MQIILKSSFIFIKGCLVFSGISKNFSFSLFFLSNKSFSLSITLEGASLIQSRTIEKPFSIALSKNPFLNFNNSVENSLSFEETNFCEPIKSLLSKFLVQ